MSKDKLPFQKKSRVAKDSAKPPRATVAVKPAVKSPGRSRHAAADVRRPSRSQPYSGFQNLWRAWLEQPPGTHLDKWLRTELPKWVAAPAARAVVVKQLHSAVGFQQLVCALEFAFQRRDPAQDWLAWDARWSAAQVQAMPVQVFEIWLQLRVGPGDSQQAHPERAQFLVQMRSFLLQDSATELLWYGLRPQWLAALQAREQGSGWSASAVQTFLQLQAVQPPLWLRTLPGADLPALAEELRREGISAAIRDGHLTLHGGRGIASSRLYREGRVEVQDLASQQAAQCVTVQPGQKVWDVCAGAGGKSLAIAAALQQKGMVLATDLHGYKLQELKRRAKRAGYFNIRSFTWDASAPLQLPREVAQQQGFDWLLVDAPCSASGTWRRNPDARWRYADSDTESLLQLQQQILLAALPALRAGGRLVYATCSWDVRENEQQVQWLLHQQPDLALISQQLLGCPLADSDTLFVAVLEKR